VTFDLGPVTFDPEIPFCYVSPERMHILGWYLQDDVLWDKGVSHGGIVAM
jgi:hypothetical protein